MIDYCSASIAFRPFVRVLFRKVFLQKKMLPNRSINQSDIHEMLLKHRFSLHNKGFEHIFDHRKRSLTKILSALVHNLVNSTFYIETRKLMDVKTGLVVPGNRGEYIVPLEV